jgi:hypothetical protein
VYSESQSNKSYTGIEIIGRLDFISSIPVESISSCYESKEIRWQTQPLGMDNGKMVQIGKVFENNQEIADYYYVLEPLSV